MVFEDEILEEIKNFIRVDSLEDDILLLSLKTSAEEYLANAGVIKDYSKELYKLAIKLLISHWYDNRDVERIGKNISKISYSLDSIITQLKYCEGF